MSFKMTRAPERIGTRIGASKKAQAPGGRAHHASVPFADRARFVESSIRRFVPEVHRPRALPQLVHLKAASRGPTADYLLHH